MDIAAHLRTRNHSNIVPINDRSYVRISKNLPLERRSSSDSEDEEVKKQAHEDEDKRISYECDQCDKQFAHKYILSR